MQKKRQNRDFVTSEWRQDPIFRKKFYFSKILLENFQHDRVGHIFATCDYMGQKPQKHAFLAILPYPPIYTYLKR